LNTFWNYYCFVFRINLPWCCHMKTHKFFQNVKYACMHLTWFFHFILIMQIGEILHNTKCFWIAFDKFSFIPILFFAHESNVQKCFLGSIFTHLLHYFISILQIEELLHNTKCFWETFDKFCLSFWLGEQNQLIRKKKLELKVEWKKKQLKITCWQFEIQLKKLELEGKEMELKRQEVETCNLQFQLKLAHNFALKNFKLK